MYVMRSRGRTAMGAEFEKKSMRHPDSPSRVARSDNARGVRSGVVSRHRRSDAMTSNDRTALSFGAIAVESELKLRNTRILRRSVRAGPAARSNGTTPDVSDAFG